MHDDFNVVVVVVVVVVVDFNDVVVVVVVVVLVLLPLKCCYVLVSLHVSQIFLKESNLQGLQVEGGARGGRCKMGRYCSETCWKAPWRAAAPGGYQKERAPLAAAREQLHQLAGNSNR